MKEKEIIETRFKSKVLCMFLGGSNAYGLKSSNSDRDIMVIIENDSELVHIPFYKDTIDGKTEFFVMGKNYFKKVHSFDENTNDFLVAHADNIIGINLEGNLLYLDDGYKEEFYAIASEDWLAKLAKFLHRFVNFYRLTIVKNAPNYKKHYHIYRIRAMLDNLDKTGSFNLDYVEPYKSMMAVYKEHYKMIPSKQEEFDALLDYIEEYANRLEVK